MIEVRCAGPEEVPALAGLWYAAWQDAHAAIVPPALVRLRTLESFAQRLAADLTDVRVVGPAIVPLGFNRIDGDELNQLFVSAAARGTGVAAALIADAETRLRARGVETAWLACAVGNERAARFYEKCGWRCAGTFASQLDTADGPFTLEVWRYEKRLARY